jgi:hypothetical protein
LAIGDSSLLVKSTPLDDGRARAGEIGITTTIHWPLSAS